MIKEDRMSSLQPQFDIILLSEQRPGWVSLKKSSEKLPPILSCLYGVLHWCHTLLSNLKLGFHLSLSTSRRCARKCKKRKFKGCPQKKIWKQNLDHLQIPKILRFFFCAVQCFNFDLYFPNISIFSRDSNLTSTRCLHELAIFSTLPNALKGKR